MPSIELTALYEWVRNHLNKNIYLGYTIHKINGQEANKVLILLKLSDSRHPDAELEAIWLPNKERYFIQFTLLRSSARLPEPQSSVTFFNHQEEIINWLQTGNMSKL
nr:hypothetical protein [uncultured Arsenicibacter sp.]